ncbi:MAG: site-specific integrase [Phycisphaerales bacterium]|nr:site-specific integrase [Phycisphaerales bacterium]
MASVSISAEGLAKVQYLAGGVRRTLHLGRVSRKAADAVRVHVEALLAWPRTGTLAPSTAAWVAGLDDRMHERLVGLGLLPARAARRRRTVADLLDAVKETRQWKAGTLAGFCTNRASIEAHLGATTPVELVTPEQAERFAAAMAEQGLARATIAKRVAVARQVFAKAAKWGWIARDPFDGVKAGSQANPDRLHYVSAEVFERVLAEVRDPELRLVLCLGRYAGLRLPSEVVGLKWSDLSDWSRSPLTLTIRSTKTETTRVVPVVPRLARELLAGWERAAEGAEYVLGDRRRGGCLNWRRGLEWACSRAGVKAWPRLLHALRGSFCTDISARFPSHLARQWCGHSEQVAVGHYLSTLESDLAKACAMDDFGRPAQPTHQTTQPTPQTTQNPTQRGAAQTGREGQTETGTADSVLEAALCPSVPHPTETLMTPRGFEPLLPG